MKFLKITLLSFIFCFFLNISSFSKDKFAFVCKSFNRDLQRSVVMYKSIEEYCTEKYPFYFIVPSKEKELFVNTFKESLKAGEIKTLPVFLQMKRFLQNVGF